MSDTNKFYLPTNSTDRRVYDKKTSNPTASETVAQKLLADDSMPGGDPVCLVTPGPLGSDKINRVLAPSLLHPSPSTESGLTLLVTGKLNHLEQELLFRKIRDRKPEIAGFTNAEDGEILTVDEFHQKIKN